MGVKKGKRKLKKDYWCNLVGYHKETNNKVIKQLSYKAKKRSLRFKYI